MPLAPDRWTITHVERSADRVPVGLHGWTLPRKYKVTLNHSAEPFGLQLECRFEGSRVKVVTVTLNSRNGRSVTPRDLSAVELARAVFLLTEAELRPEHAVPTDRRLDRRADDDELRLVASVYAFAHAAWGNPRQAVMGLWGLPRATANRWIRKARELHPGAMPTDGHDAHLDGDQP